MSFRETERHWKWESAQQKIEREKDSWFIFSETPQRKQHVLFLVIFLFARTHTNRLIMEMENSHLENI